MLRVPDSLLGQAVKCPSCAQTFNAPEDADSIPPPRPAARSSPARPTFEEEEERPARRAPPRRRDEEEDEDYRPARRRRRYEDDDDYDRPRDEKPGKVQAIAVMTLAGGILATMLSLGFMVILYGFCWPGTYYGLVMGIMAIIKGSQLLSPQAHRQSPPNSIAIMQIINIINCDWINMTLGIINLVFLSDDEVKDYFYRR